MTSWINVILTIIKYLPAAIAILKQIWELIEQIQDGDEKAQAHEALKTALADSKDKKEVRPLFAFEDALKRRLRG